MGFINQQTSLGGTILQHLSLVIIIVMSWSLQTFQRWKVREARNSKDLFWTLRLGTGQVLWVCWNRCYMPWLPKLHGFHVMPRQEFASQIMGGSNGQIDVYKTYEKSIHVGSENSAAPKNWWLITKFPPKLPQDDAPQWCLLVYKAHEYYSCICHKP